MCLSEELRDARQRSLERRQCVVGTGCAQLLDGVFAGRHTDTYRADCVRRIDVSWRVADDLERAAREVLSPAAPAELDLAPLGDCVGPAEALTVDPSTIGPAPIATPRRRRPGRPKGDQSRLRRVLDLVERASSLGWATSGNRMETEAGRGSKASTLRSDIERDLGVTLLNTRTRPDKRVKGKGYYAPHKL